MVLWGNPGWRWVGPPVQRFSPVDRGGAYRRAKCIGVILGSDVAFNYFQLTRWAGPQFLRGGAHGVNVLGGFLKHRRGVVASDVMFLERDRLFLGQRAHDIRLGNLVPVSRALVRIQRHDLMVGRSAVRGNGTVGPMLRAGVTGRTGDK